jgi:tetratricopeptide (TPR) repeat protein
MKHIFIKALTTSTFTLLFLASFGQQGTELLIQANRATLERDYTQAIALYNQYIKLNPEDFRGYFNRGTTEMNARKYTEAEQDFTKTLSLNPVYKEAYYYRGQSFVKQTKYDLAIKDYTHILDKDPRSVPFLKLRAEAYSEKKQNDLALDDLDFAIHTAKLEGDLYKRRAELKIILQDIEGALKDYHTVEKLMPKYKMVHYIKGNLYLEIKETDFACEEYKIALDNAVVVADRAYQEHCQ